MSVFLNTLYYMYVQFNIATTMLQYYQIAYDEIYRQISLSEYCFCHNAILISLLTII